MEWMGDVSAGAWLRDRLDGGPGARRVVPSGFPSYARVFHPASRDRPVGVEWPPLPEGRHRREWAAFRAARPELVDERVRWADAAAAFGATMHPLAQWSELVGRLRPEPGEDGPRDAAGWRYQEPAPGGLPGDLVAAAASVLAAHTTTPRDGVVAVWAGWGGLLGFHGETPARTFLTAAVGGDAVLERHNAMLARSIPDRFNNVFLRPGWQPGILSDEISRGPRLELPAREHVLFRGGVAELADPDGMRHAPWRDREAGEHGLDAQAPSLVWPDDRAWVMVADVDLDSTVVGGDPALIAALVADPRLEAAEIPVDADLTRAGGATRPDAVGG